MGAAGAFVGQAIRDSGLSFPQKITTNKTTEKALNYQKVIGERNCGVDWADRLMHVDKKYRNNQKYRNNRIESDHATLKKILRPMRGFKN